MKKKSRPEFDKMPYLYVYNIITREKKNDDLVTWKIKVHLTGGLIVKNVSYFHFLLWHYIDIMKLFRISIKTARGRLYIRLYNALGRFKYNDGYLYSYGKIMVGALCVVDLHSSVSRPVCVVYGAVEWIVKSKIRDIEKINDERYFFEWL